LNISQLPIAYVTNTDSDDISVVSISARKEIGRIPIGGSPRGSVRFDADKRFGYVSNCAGNTISVLDLSSNTEVGKIEVGLAPRGLTLSGDGAFAYVSNSGENTLSVVDLDSRSVVSKIEMSDNPRHMGISSDGSMIFVSQWGSDSIAVIDVSAPTKPRVVKEVSVGENARPYSVAVHHGSDVLFVANTQATYISVIDTRTLEEVNRIEVGYGGRAITLNRDKSYAFASVENTNELVSINTRDQSVRSRVEVGPSPRGIAYVDADEEVEGGSFSRSAFVNPAARNALFSVNVKDPENLEVVGYVKVGLGPCSVSILQ